jgi:hypothetical protein
MIERINEKAMNAKNPLRLIAGISIHLVLKPMNVKLMTLNIGTISVAMYSTTAEETHLNNPKVTKFKGNSKMLIIGFASKDTAVIAAPVKSSVYMPPSNTKPPAIWVIPHKEKVSIA